VANQIIVALTIEAVAEALLFASKAGADPERMINRTFNPGLSHRATPEGPEPRAAGRARTRRQPAA
jgi:NAD-binding of NADP-dependent 3-hydroxyisobutyrate dehydrogenase